MCVAHKDIHLVGDFDYTGLHTFPHRIENKFEEHFKTRHSQICNNRAYVIKRNVTLSCTVSNLQIFFYKRNDSGKNGFVNSALIIL